jgi:membrane-bound serine protease (ClpP class)
MGADLLIVDIDSPGGLVEESFRIANRLQSTDWARTVAYVPRQALSGAAIVSLGCDEIVMHADARLGDAGPITLGEDMLFRHVPEKIVSDLAVQIRQLAEGGGRPPALAEAMIDKSLEVYRVRHAKTGDVAFMSEAEIADADVPDDWQQEKLVFESREDHFLEVTGRRAVELTLAAATVEDLDQLQQRYGLKSPPVVLSGSWVDTLVYILNHPVITVLLFVVGLIGIYIEFSAPGVGVGGMLAGVCFLLFFWSRFFGGTADWLDILLFAGGVVCLALELFVIPGFGVTGFTGVLLILASVLLAGQRNLIPQTGTDLRSLVLSLGICVTSGVLFAGTAWFISQRFHMIPAMNRLIVEPPKTDDTAPSTDRTTSPTAGALDRGTLAGQRGAAYTALRPAGRARFGQHVIEVTTEGESIAQGQPVRVVEVSGNRVVVTSALTDD